MDSKSVRRSRGIRGWLGVVLGLALLAAAGPAAGVDLDVENPPYNSYTPYTITGGTQTYDTVYVGQRTSGAVFSQSGGTNTVGVLSLGNKPGGEGIYNLSGGSLFVAESTLIGFGGIGKFTQNGGTHTTGALGLGRDGGFALYRLQQGTLVTGSLVVGLSGSTGDSVLFHMLNGTLMAEDEVCSGAFVQSDGTNSSTGMSLIAGGYYIQNGGTNTVSDNLLILNGATYYLNGGSLSVNAIGLNDGGTFCLGAGSLNYTILEHVGTIVGNLVNRATYYYLGGTFNGRLLNYGTANFNNYSFTATDGLLQAASATPLTIGDGQNFTLGGAGLTNNGVMTLTGTGALTATNEYIGFGGTGAFTQSGGTHTVPFRMELGGSGGTGTFALQEGTLTAGGITVHGGSTFTQSGGTLAISSDSGEGGTLNLNGGTLMASGTGAYLNNALRVGGDYTIGGSNNLTVTGAVELSSGAGTVVNSADTTFSRAISGAGSLVLNSAGGAGNLIMFGANTYSGGTTLTSGILVAVTSSGGGGASGPFGPDAAALNLNGGALAAGGAARTATNTTINMNGDVALGTAAANQNLTLGQAAGAFNLGAGTDRTLTVNNTTQIDSVVTGAGSTLTKAGAGNLILTAANTYNGLTTVNGGTLTLKDSGALPGSVIVNQATFNNYSIPAQSVGGVTTINNGGTYKLTVAGPCSGDITLNAGGTLNMNGLGTYNGTVTNQGGTFNLSGIITYTNPLANSAGDTFVIPAGSNVTITGGETNSGTVDVGGTLTGDLANNAGGTVGGGGTITGALVNHGTVNPGNSPGTLTVGTYTSTPGSTQVVEIASATNYDRIVTTAAGGATLNGGTLSPRLVGGFLPSTNQLFPGVVQATGGGAVTGAFAGIDNTRVGASRTLFWQALYTPTTADLKAVANYTPPDLVLSRNQRSVANALNAIAPSTTGGDALTVLDAINALTTDAGVRAAYHEISPAKYAALPTLTLPITRMQFQYLQNRLARERWEAELGREPVSAGGGGFMRGFNFGFNSETRSLLAASNLTISDAGTPMLRQGVEQRWGIYLEPMANWGAQSATANMVGYRYKNFGFTLGAEYWVRDNLLVGVNAGYNKTLGSVGGSGGDLNANVIPVNAYGAFFHRGFYANATVGYTYSGYDLERNIAFGTINRTAKASTSGNQFQLGAETGYDARLGNAVVGPVLSLQYATQTVGGFTESNAGALSLRVGSQSANSVQSGVGVRASYNAKAGNVPVKPQLSVTWQHEFSDNTRGLNASLAAGGSTVNFQTDRTGQDFALISLDVPAKITKNLVANVGYTAEVGRDKSTNMGVNVGLKLKW